MQDEFQGEAVRSSYNNQTRGMVMKVYQYIQNQALLMSEADLKVETASATGISVRTLQRIKKEVRDGGIRSPSGKRKRNSPVMDSKE